MLTSVRDGDCALWLFPGPISMKSNAYLRRSLVNESPCGALEPELISVKRLAQLLDCSPKTLRDWLYKDRKSLNIDPLPYYRVGGMVRFRVTEVLAWIERRRVRVSSVGNL